MVKKLPSYVVREYQGMEGSGWLDGWWAFIGGGWAPFQRWREEVAVFGH